MAARKIRNFDKTFAQTFKVMRSVVIKLGYEIVSIDKNKGFIDIITKKKFIFFGGNKIALNARNLSENDTEVIMTARDNISPSAFKEIAKTIFHEMDKELPVTIK